MIDFHSHILPNIDDGAKSIEESVNLIKEAKQAGFTGIVLTSHYIEGTYVSSQEKRSELVEKLKEEMKKEKLDIDLYLASEIYMTENIVDLISTGKASSVNGSRYVLFEMPLSIENEPIMLYNMIYALQEKRFIPILAHPERYKFIQKNPNYIYDLVQKGVLMQVNYGSVVGQYGTAAEQTAKKFLKHNMVHFFGSDVHREQSVYIRVPDVLKAIEKIIGKDKLEEITKTNPEQVISNNRIDIDDPREITLTTKDKIKKFLKL